MASVGVRVSIVRCHGVLWRRVRWYLQHHTAAKREVHAVVVKAHSKYFRSAVVAVVGSRERRLAIESLWTKLRKLQTAVCGAGCQKVVSALPVRTSPCSSV